MVQDRALWAAFILSASVHAAAVGPHWGTFGPAGTGVDEWDCAFTVGSRCETEGPAPSSAAFVPAPPAGAGDRAASPAADPGREEGPAARECAASVPTQAPAPRADRDARPERRAAEGSAPPPALLASLPSQGSDGRTARPRGGGRDEYLDAVRRRISRMKRFPPEALREGLEGTAVVGFRIARDGAASGVRVVRSSRAPILDSEGETTVRRAAPFPPIPECFGPAPIDLQVPISFEIERR